MTRQLLPLPTLLAHAAAAKALAGPTNAARPQTIVLRPLPSGKIEVSYRDYVPKTNETARPPTPPPPDAGPRNDKAALPGGLVGDQENQHAEFTDKPTSTATAVQRDAIVELLRVGPRTTFELRRLAGAMQASTRVFELRKRGFKITMERIEAADEAGLVHGGVALYRLQGEPGVQS